MRYLLCLIFGHKPVDTKYSLSGKQIIYCEKDFVCKKCGRLCYWSDSNMPILLSKKRNK